MTTQPTHAPRPPETAAERDARHALNQPLIDAFNAMSDAPPETRTLLALDARGRISLGALAAHKLYQGRREEDGTIVLTPVFVFTKDAIDQAMADGERAVASLLADVRGSAAS